MLGRPRLIPYGCEEMMYFLLRCYLMEDLGPLGDASTPECSRLKKLLLVKPLNKFSVFLLSLLHLGKTIRADMLPYNSYIKKKKSEKKIRTSLCTHTKKYPTRYYCFCHSQKISCYAVDIHDVSVGHLDPVVQSVDNAIH